MEALPEWIWPVGLLLAAIATGVFSMILERWAPEQIRQHYGPRFEQRSKFSFIMVGAAALWALTLL